MNREELFELYQDTLDNLEAVFNSGSISSEEAQYHAANIDAEFSNYLSQINGTDEDMAEFEAGNGFGEVLLLNAEENGYEDVEEYIEDLSEVTGLTPEEIAELIVSEEEPNEDLAEGIAGILGIDEEEEDDEDDYEDDDEGAEADLYDDSEDDDETYEDARYSALENQLAEFQMQGLLKDALAQRETKARELLENGDLPPIAYQILISNFSSESDRLAAFSELAVQNGVSVEAELHALDKTLGVFERMGLGNMGIFDQIVEDSISEYSMNEDAEAEAQAIRNREYNKKRKANLI